MDPEKITNVPFHHRSRYTISHATSIRLDIVTLLLMYDVRIEHRE
jgi:hypothetical protein